MLRIGLKREAPTPESRNFSKMETLTQKIIERCTSQKQLDENEEK